MDLIARLRNPRWFIVKREVGDPPGEDRRLDEDEAIAVMKEAADEIEHLRSVAGSVSRGESFNDMRKRASY